MNRSPEQAAVLLDYFARATAALQEPVEELRQTG
jgi:hypothetical protein